MLEELRVAGKLQASSDEVLNLVQVHGFRNEGEVDKWESVEEEEGSTMPEEMDEGSEDVDPADRDALNDDDVLSSEFLIILLPLSYSHTYWQPEAAENGDYFSLTDLEDNLDDKDVSLPSGRRRT